MNPYPGWMGTLFVIGQWAAPWLLGGYWAFVLCSEKPKRCPKHTKPPREIIFRARGVFVRF